MRCCVVVLCTLLAAYAAGNATPHPWEDLGQYSATCRELKERDFSVPNCEEAATCFKAAREMAKACIVEDIKDENIKMCHRKDEIKDMRKSFIQKSCQMHLATSKCMAGEDSTGFVTNDAVMLFKRDIQTHISELQPNECWRNFMGKLQACKMLGNACDHFKTCSGQEDEHAHDDSFSGWFDVVKPLRAEVQTSLLKFLRALKKCVSEAAA